MYSTDLDNTINDCHVDIAGNQPSEERILELKQQIPQDILLIGEQWGWYDTEFRESVFKWMKTVLK